MRRRDQRPLPELAIDDRATEEAHQYYEYKLPSSSAQQGKVVHPAEPRSARFTLRVNF
jgi:hypothetical protein